MKGGMMRRLRNMKTKSIHGVSSAHHDNPHVLRAGRASGGRCAEVEGDASPPRLSSPMRAKGGKVGFANKVQAPMPPAASKSDAARVQKGMDGKDKNRAFGGKVMKSPGDQGKGFARVEGGSSSKGKDDGMTKNPKGDGTTNKSGKKFKDGGATGKDGEKSDEDDEAAAEAEEDDDEADEAAAKKVAEDAKSKAYGVRTEERKHGGKVKRAMGGGADSDIPDPEDPRGRAMVDNMINDAPPLDMRGVKRNVTQGGTMPTPPPMPAGLQGQLIHEMQSAGPEPFRKSGGKVGFNPGGEKGKLHRELGIDEGKKIPAKRLAKAEHSKDPEIAGDAKRAETMKKWKH